MAFSGQVLDNPISGERFIFHKTSGHPAQPGPPAALPAWEPRGGQPPAHDWPAGLRTADHRID